MQRRDRNYMKIFSERQLNYLRQSTPRILRLATRLSSKGSTTYWWLWWSTIKTSRKKFVKCLARHSTDFSKAHSTTTSFKLACLMPGLNPPPQIFCRQVTSKNKCLSLKHQTMASNGSGLLTLRLVIFPKLLAATMFVKLTFGQTKQKKIKKSSP